MKYLIIVFIMLVASSVCLKSQNIIAGIDKFKFENISVPSIEKETPKTVKKKPSCHTYSLEHKELVNVFPAQIYSFAQIEFSVPEKGNISIDVIDMNGNKVLNIVPSEVFEKGTYKRTITSKDLRKGTYYVTLKMENYKETKKITVAR